MLSEKQGKTLLKLARDTIAAAFDKKDVDISDLKEEFYEEQGVFVTLKLDGNLRGCIGFPEPIFPLYKAIVEAAKSAAFGDPRFPELTLDEFQKVELEVTVLTKPELLEVKKSSDYLKLIKLGKDGLIARFMGHSGLLLPQVPVEWNWTIEEFLENLCLKAGLPPQTWKDDGFELLSFQGQIFNE